MINPHFEECDENLGTHCGAYELTHFIAAGGFSRVYRGEKAGGEIAAVKVLDTIRAKHKDTAERFLRESKLIAAIDHSNVVRFVDAGVTRNKLWLAMELLDGETLRSCLARAPSGRLAETEALRIAYEAGCGIAHAQRIGAIHRDLKPENLFLTSKGEVKVLDFGIAKLYSSGIESTNRIKDGVLGTPSYMTPEQINGERVGFYSDVFQLALVLYEMLTGRYAFSDEGGAIPSPKDLSLLLLRGTPRPLAEGAVSPAVARLLERALQKNPRDRFPTMAAFAEEIWEVLVDLREEEAALGLATDHTNPASSDGRPLGSGARRAYSPVQTPPPSERPPALPSKSVRLRSDLVRGAAARTESVRVPSISRTFVRVAETERMDAADLEAAKEKARNTLPASAPQPGRAPRWLSVPGGAALPPPEPTRELPASSTAAVVAAVAPVKTTKRPASPALAAPVLHRVRAWFAAQEEEGAPRWLLWLMVASASSSVMIMIYYLVLPRIWSSGPAMEPAVAPAVSASASVSSALPPETAAPLATAAPSASAASSQVMPPAPPKKAAPPAKASAAPARPRPSRPAPGGTRPPFEMPGERSRDIF